MALIGCPLTVMLRALLEIDHLRREPDAHLRGAGEDVDVVCGDRALDLRGPSAGGRRPVRGIDLRFRRHAVQFDPPEEIVPSAHRRAGEFAGEEIAAEAAHPVEDPQNFVVKIVVAAALVLDHRGVVAAFQVAVQIEGVFGEFRAVQFAENHVKRHVLGVFPIEGAIAVGLGRDGNHACPKIGMGQADVPRRVAAHRMAGQIHAIGVDGEPPAGVAQPVQHGGVFAGRVVVLFLMFLGPLRGDDDVAVAGRLAVAHWECGGIFRRFLLAGCFSSFLLRGAGGLAAFSFFSEAWSWFDPIARPPVDLAFGGVARAVERDDGRI